MSLIKKIISENKSSKVSESGIFIPVKVGDIILTGRFKNKKTEVKSIGVNKHGMPTINGKNITRFRFLNKSENGS